MGALLYTDISLKHILGHHVWTKTHRMLILVSSTTLQGIRWHHSFWRLVSCLFVSLSGLLSAHTVLIQQFGDLDRRPWWSPSNFLCILKNAWQDLIQKNCELYGWPCCVTLTLSNMCILSHSPAPARLYISKVLHKLAKSLAVCTNSIYGYVMFSAISWKCAFGHNFNHMWGLIRIQT